jgi:hypothetical protein
MDASCLESGENAMYEIPRESSCIRNIKIAMKKKGRRHRRRMAAQAAGARPSIDDVNTLG